MRKLILLIFISFSIAGCTGNDNDKVEEPDNVPAPVATPIINYKVVNTFPHDTSLFTEGLLVHKGQLFESTGSPDGSPGLRSMIGIIDLNSGKMSTKVEIDKSKYFGEGIGIIGDKLYQLTYKNQLGFIYDLKTFKQRGTFKYANSEGWGMSNNGKDLIMSDGTENLTFLTPDSLKPTSTLRVTEDGQPVSKLNELEYINGFIYANIWTTNLIVKIDPHSGKVVGKMDLSAIALEARNRNPDADVLNGIAYDPATDKIFVTGKLWSNIYQIDFAL
jgi:glutamine cyclotransferase